MPSLPPQTIIFEPVHTAVCSYRAEGAPAALTADQPSADAVDAWKIATNTAMVRIGRRIFLVFKASSFTSA